MSVPKFDEFFIPILKVLSDKKEVHVGELSDMILKDKFFNLLNGDLKEETSSGANLFKDRISWGKAYLKQGKFVEQKSRGYVNISNKGLELLKNESVFLLKDLRKDIDFESHEGKQKIKKNKNGEIKKTENVSPQDMIDFGFNDILDLLKNELLEKLKKSNPYYFEKIILQLFKKMGYGEFQETKKTGDGGIDGIINQDALGIERIYTQAKRYTTSNVGERDIRNFIGAMSGDVSKGIFVTTSDFDPAAYVKVRDARNHKIILINGEKLVDLMIKYNLGVQVKDKYLIKEIDEEFFIED